MEDRRTDAPTRSRVRKLNRLREDTEGDVRRQVLHQDTKAFRDRTEGAGTVIKGGRPPVPGSLRPVGGQGVHETCLAQGKTRELRRVWEEEGGDCA